ncbi:TRAP transporter substrate-binding protein [Achromobacter xylosoxidans]|uniref:Signal peptidase n=1 Tax=Alcaligenes xylosoxydans xylosoxydans TaxID=85698 RepID=A0A424WD31_ALCXX|nr:TRAP transporter substrate-binding protein [Achromobacter xylosoxidans]MBC9906291.1 TRAP transporter substrate-binding protein [Achromobacter xylosoxidans]MBD0869947.1 TRAP transporter substrate-binding protein [Achromobacter xylosoxidans]QNP87296.1 TRAP transporter substrate-binding protein [Achromobacter xylosoxidans]RPJ91157.1 signal peptidase [Achromobacter xylosoxidans]
MQSCPTLRLMTGIAMAFMTHGAYAVTTLTMTTEYPATSMPGQGVSTFAELVRAKTAGNVVIDASYDASKGIKSADMIDAVQARKVDAGDAFAGALAAKYPLFGVSSLPFLADSLSKARNLNKAARPAYEKLLAAHGQKLLYTTPWPASGIWSKQKLDSVAALKKLSIRTYDATSQDVMQKAGARAQNISFADAMPLIASGEVNAVLSSGDGGAGRKLWEHLPNFAEINYAMPISVATMNLQAYQALDARTRRAIDQAAAQTETEQWKRIDGRLQQNYANMRKNGVAINTSVPLPVQRALKDAAADSVKNWKAAAGPEAAAILKQTGKR